MGNVLCSLNKKGNKARSLGLAPGTIQTFDRPAPSFIVAQFGKPSFSGSPIFANDKIIGVYSWPDGIRTNADILRDPYHQAKTGTVTKVVYIIPLLKALHDRENMPGFN